MKNKPLLIIMVLLAACNAPKEKPSGKKIPVIGYLDFVQDPTLAKAKQGFFDALEKGGFSEKDSTIQIIYNNAQGDIPTLGQSCDLLISKNVELIATNTTLSTITAVQRTKTIPVCMMVAPRPDLAHLTDSLGNNPPNLFGTYETLDYIDTAVTIIKTLKPSAKKIGTVYNQSEPQSRDAYSKLETKCKELGLTLVSLPVNNSSETQLVTQSLLSKGIDVFFALPDNVIFASFETIAKSCNDKNVPIFTSEAGLVDRGAVASFGADFYLWGYQAGEQAVEFLKTNSLKNLKPEIVKVRKRIYNPQIAKKFNIVPDSSFVMFK
jgi:putative ABC transport system substrate-binding protein